MDKYINKGETIERINRLFTKNHDGSVAKNDYNSGLYAAKAEIVFITAADVQPVDRWISCEDKMPDDGVNVLIYAGNRAISLAWYDKDMGYFYICDSDYKYNSLDVTHWQPLPEPPKEGRK